MVKNLRRFFALFFLLPIVASCYVPDDFTCEIRVGKNGDYSITYNGTLTWAPLVMDIHDNKLSPAEIQQFGDSVVGELRRISEFSEVTPLSPGKVRVKYLRNGHIKDATKISFPRNGADFITMIVKTDGTLTILSTAKPKMTQVQKLDAANITSHGLLRVVTDLDVLKTNAQITGKQVQGYPGWYIFDWNIASLGQPPPVLQARLFPEGFLKSATR